MSLYDSYVKIAAHEHVRKIISHRHFVKYEKYASVIIWLAAIYYLSSNSLTFLATADIWSFILRKIAHMFEFAVLTYLIFRILGQTEKRHVLWNIFWSFAFTVIYSVSDEYHQAFISGRVGTYKDVFIDSIGSLVAVWLIYLNWHYKQKLKNKTKKSLA